MKTRIHFLLIPALALGCGADEPREPEVDTPVEVVRDIVAAAPDMASVIFENQYVRAILFRLQPGDELPEHAGHPRAVYSLSDYRILWTEAGESSEKEWRAGQAHWHDAIRHAVSNIGESEALFLVVARKDAALPEVADLHAEHDAAAAEDGYGRLVFENEHVRITEVMLPPEAAQAEHHGLNRLVYSLSDYSIRYTSDRFDTVERTFARGDAHWHEADEHAVENIGTTEARFVIFQFKG
jgi:quercetin dioxygenase-like cupin family protein